MPPWWMPLLDEQRRTGFADFAGARGSLTLPIPDHLLTRVARERMPPGAPVRDLEIQALAGNQIAVRARLTRPSFLPPLTIRFFIERQPHLPGSPILVLRLASTGISALAGPVLSIFNALPPGVTRDGDLLLVNLRTMAETQGVSEFLNFFTSIEVSTQPGRVVVVAEGGTPSRS